MPIPTARRIAFFRHDLLPLSNTFILKQGNALPRSTVVFAGLRKVHGLDISGSPHATLGPIGSLMTEARVGAGKVTGRFPTLERFLDQQQCKLIHAHFGNEAWWAVPLARKVGIPLIATFHGMDASCMEQFHRRPDTPGIPSTIRRLHRHRMELAESCHKVIAVSQFIKNLLLEVGFPERQVIVHRIGVDVDALSRVLPAVDVPGRYFLFVGRLVEKKGILDLLDAWDRARPDCDLRIIGSGPLETVIRQRCQSLPRVVIHGAEPHARVLSLMKGAYALIAPSRRAANGDCEGLPTVVCEAMALGTPVIATTHAGIPEACQDGQQGLLVAEADTHRLAESLNLIIHDAGLRQRFGDLGRQRASSQFNISVQSTELDGLYDMALRQ